MKKKRFDIFKAFCLLMALIGIVVSLDRPLNAGMTMSLVFLVLAYGLHLIEEHRWFMQYQDLDKDIKVLQDKLKYTKEEVKLWRDKANIHSYAAAGGHMFAKPDICMGFDMGLTDESPPCQMFCHTSKKRGPKNIQNLPKILEATGPSFVEEPADPAGRKLVIPDFAELAKHDISCASHHNNMTEGGPLPYNCSYKDKTKPVLDMKGMVIAPTSPERKIFPEIFATHTIGVVDLNEMPPEDIPMAARVEIKKEAYDDMTPEQLEKISKETMEFVNKIEDAHKDAAHSTLHFGPRRITSDGES